LVLSGGFFMNSVLYGKITSNTPFKNIYVSYAPADLGNSMGAALYVNHVILKQKRHFNFNSSYLGPEFSNDEIEKILKNNKISYEKLDKRNKILAKLLSEKNIIAVFKGKAEFGEHDENITYETTVDILGETLANRVRNLALALYSHGIQHAKKRGIIIADTKFEFGLDENGKLYLIDEVLTPDSSRFWAIEDYQLGISPPSFDKQYLRDYLETLDWDKTAPGPKLPQDIIDNTAAKYKSAYKVITGKNN